MKVLSVNCSLPKTLVINGNEVSTGIYKEPVITPVPVRKLGLEGDGQADLTVHGGEYQAVYAYPVEHYAYWQAELACEPLSPGSFGENLTVSGLLETDVCIGDLHRIGQVVLQVTGPRIPCFKLGHRVHRPGILKPFLQSGRSGFYYRVVQEGALSASEEVEVIQRDPRGVSVRSVLGMYRLGEGTPEGISQALEIEALVPFVRRDFDERLRAA